MTQFILTRCKSIQAMLLLFSATTAGLAILPSPANEATAAPALHGEMSAAASINCAAALVDAHEAEAALALLEESPLPEKDERYRYFHTLALAHHELGQYEAAYRFVEKTIRANPHFEPAYALKQQYRVDRSPIAK